MSFFRSLIWQISNMKTIVDPSPIKVIQMRIDDLVRKQIENKEHMVLLKQSILADEEVIRELNLYKKQLIQSETCHNAEATNVVHLESTDEKSMLSTLRKSTHV